MHFITFISRENNSVVYLLGSHSDYFCFLKKQTKTPPPPKKPQPSIQNTWNPKSVSWANFSVNRMYISLWPFCPFPCSLLCLLEPASAQLRPEGDCGNTWWSSQCGKLFLVCCHFFKLHPKRKTDPCPIIVCKICTRLFQLLMFIITNISCFRNS